MQVFEYMQTDLEIVIKDRGITLSPADVKSFMQMVLQGLNFCHKRWVLHRDVKPNNFLISEQGVLELCVLITGAACCCRGMRCINFCTRQFVGH